MKKRLVTFFLTCLIILGVFISVANFTSRDTDAGATYGTWFEVEIFNTKVIEDCVGDPSDCCVVTPDN
jgi:hypothetical protein